jgi:phosphatidylinositol alpha-1,6-mannosyltransferase
MKILLVTEVFPPRTGGSGRWFWELYRRLPRGQVVIAAGADPRQDEFDRTHDLAVARLPLTFRSWGVCGPRSLWNYGRAVRRLHRLVRTERVGVVHAGRCLPEGLLARALKAWHGLPYVCYVHGEELYYASTSRQLTWLTRGVLSGADRVIANSRNTLRLLQNEWAVPAARVRLLHPGVDTQRFVPAPRSARVRDQLGWGDRPVVLTAGRLQQRKGQDQMIRALPAIRQPIPEVLYAIVGGGPERASLEGLAAGAGLGGHVQFLGEVDEDTLLRCYQQCDLFALPNRQVGPDIEGFGMVLVEAQACGKPVLAGASGGTPETMRIPETGRVIPCDDPRPLATAVIELLADRPQLLRMGEAGRAWVVERFDWQPLARQAAALFQCDPPPANRSPHPEQVLA